MQTTISARTYDVPALVRHGVHPDDPGMDTQTPREAAEAEAKRAFLAEFGQRVKEAMGERDLNESRLSFATQIHETLLRRWIKGTTNPTAYGLAKLAPALGVSVDYLLGLTDEPVRSGRPPADLHELPIDDTPDVRGRVPSAPRRRRTD